jgi:AraC family transcriptional regulator
VAALGSRLYADSLALQLVIHLLRHHSIAGPPYVQRLGTLPQYKLRRALEYIDNNLHAELTLDEIARCLSMSPFHFAHLFKRTTGLSPHRYVTQRKIERAKTLLSDTDMSITEVAQQVGYANMGHFSVVFHRLLGLTPTQYRRDL